MKKVEFWNWYVPHRLKPGKFTRSSYKMDEKTMRERFPEGLEKVPGSCELREVAETQEEIDARMFRQWKEPGA